MKDKEIILRNNKKEIIKFNVNEVKYLKSAITSNYKCVEMEITLSNNKEHKFSTSYFNEDDPLTESCLNIMRYFYKKKASRK